MLKEGTVRKLTVPILCAVLHMEVCCWCGMRAVRRAGEKASPAVIPHDLTLHKLVFPRKPRYNVWE